MRHQLHVVKPAKTFPKVLSVLSQKGGAGKTTLAVHLAVLSEAAGMRTAILDLDPQASAMLWRDSRRKPGGPQVRSVAAARLQSALDEAAKEKIDLVIIDTAPQTEGAALAAARSADLIVIPCRPALLDLGAITSTLDLAAIAQRPAAVVLNAVPPRGSLSQEADTAIVGVDGVLAPVSLGHRAAFVRALTGGQTATEYEPLGKAARESRALFAWIREELNLDKSRPEMVSHLELVR